MLLGASFLGNILAGKGMNRAAEGFIRGFLIPPHSLTNFEIQKYYQNKSSLMVFILEIIFEIK